MQLKFKVTTKKPVSNPATSGTSQSNNIRATVLLLAIRNRAACLQSQVKL